MRHLVFAFAIFASPAFAANDFDKYSSCIGLLASAIEHSEELKGAVLGADAWIGQFEDLDPAADAFAVYVAELIRLCDSFKPDI